MTAANPLQTFELVTLLGHVFFTIAENVSWAFSPDQSMIVVLDTNVWISDLAMASGTGSAVRFFLSKEGARIGLPEVVKLEAEIHLRQRLVDYVDNIETSHRQLLALFGRLKEVVLPSHDQIDELIRSIWGNLGVELETIPFTLESAQRALIRTVQKTPPSDKDQQFKDCVLWEDCLVMLEKEDVYFVTNDRAFYKNRTVSLGLAPELKRDVSDYPNRFYLLPSLSDLLADISTTFSVEGELVVSEFLRAHGDRIDGLLNRNAFSLGESPLATVEVFATEDPRMLFVTFSIVFPCNDATKQDRENARILVEGDGLFDNVSQTFTEIATRGEKLVFSDKDETETILENIVVAVGSATIGHREIEHRIRRKL